MRKLVSKFRLYNDLENYDIDMIKTELSHIVGKHLKTEDLIKFNDVSREEDERLIKIHTPIHNELVGEVWVLEENDIELLEELVLLRRYSTPNHNNISSNNMAPDTLLFEHLDRLLLSFTGKIKTK